MAMVWQNCCYVDLDNQPYLKQKASASDTATLTLPNSHTILKCRVVTTIYFYLLRFMVFQLTAVNKMWDQRSLNLRNIRRISVIEKTLG
jgi:hypothetical protein